ncbi:FkbM family methyltransferase [Pseudoduganella danionis]|uniref:FkbM family methyltransferase n=1 Tax=Pseudoduganella danionis TaxID=1890295 RepID=UPI0035B2D752
MASQLGQDYFVLQVLNGLRGGYFLDTGATDGITSSNTLLLERDYGWHGICVEPNARYFAALQNNRRCLCLPDCLDQTSGVVEFVEGAGMLGGIRGHYPAMMWRYVQRCYGAQPASVRKHTRNIGELLQASAAPAVIDYWSLDTEGAELAILRGFPFEHYRFRVLTVEHNRQPMRDEIERLLNRHGYRRVHDFGIDDAYLSADLSVPASLRAAWRSAALRRR